MDFGSGKVKILCCLVILTLALCKWLFYYLKKKLIKIVDERFFNTPFSTGVHPFKFVFENIE